MATMAPCTLMNLEDPRAADQGVQGEGDVYFNARSFP